MDSPAASPIRIFLAQRVAEGATADEVMDLVAATWQQVTVVLAPVIGQRGVAALFKRSLHLASASHPWLAAPPGGSLAEIDLDALRTQFAQRSATDAATAGADFLLAFQRLVASLIGPALSERLLGGVWAQFSSGPAAQDVPP